MKRTFLAINIPVSNLMIECMQDLKSQLENEKIKWVTPSDFHITLKFLGNTSVSMIGNITDAVTDITRRHEPVRLTLTGIGVFKNIRHPRVLWMGIDAEMTLANVHDGLEHSLEQLGFEKSDKPFHPHLTLGRIKLIKNPELLGQLIEKYKTTLFHRFVADELIYYESILKRTGPEYRILKKHPLEGGNP